MFLYTLFNREIQAETILLLVFGAIIALFLIVDLGFLNRKAHKVSTKSALYQSVFWVFVSALFCLFVYVYYDPKDILQGSGENLLLDDTLEYMSCYLTEWALSVDNIFVIIIILKYFKVHEEYYHKVLFWGIFGAIVFRGVFIFLGAYLINHFHWIIYIFGVFLIYSGIKIFVQDGHDSMDPSQNPILKFCRKNMRITSDDSSGKFMVWLQGKLHFTPLFLVLIIIETSDLIFAVDSIPAAFAITNDEFIIYSSNIFAVMGLRAMFFLLAGIIDKFHLLQKGISIILVFIGAKMLFSMFGVENISPLLSFAVIVITLAASIGLSVVIPKKHHG